LNEGIIGVYDRPDFAVGRQELILICARGR
jgi:hypothetical protein